MSVHIHFKYQKIYFFIVVVLVLLNNNKPALRSDLNNASKCTWYINTQILEPMDKQFIK